MKMWRRLHPAARPLMLLFLLALVIGCGGKKTNRSRVSAPPPEIAQTEAAATPSKETSREIEDTYRNHQPIYVETGLASWYGPPYHNRKAANGDTFDMNRPTAAHKTLPLNSIVRVTNLKNGKSAVLRINDRGPFIGDRIVDLSMAAAKQIDLYRAGVGMVKLEVLEAPAPLDRGGRWAVQIGAFKDREAATRLKDKLTRRYRTAKVIQFTGPTGEWVRVRPLNDERSRAFEVARDTKASEGGVFLVRLD